MSWESSNEYTKVNETQMCPPYDAKSYLRKPKEKKVLYNMICTGKCTGEEGMQKDGRKGDRQLNLKSWDGFQKVKKEWKGP